MAIRGVHFKWYDGFFLSMLAFSIVMVLLSWKRYNLCKFPLHMWIVIDYAVVFVFRILMFVDSALADKMGLDYGRQQRDAYFLGRLVVLSILYVVLYPFLWAWSITGSIWFTSAHTCLPEKNQKWGFLVWLIFSYGGLICLAIYLVNKWLARRKVHLERAQLGITVSRISEYRVLVDMIRLPDRVFENAAEEMRAMEHDTATHHPGLYLSENQRQAVEVLIHELPLFSLKAVPSDCSDCPICLEEFHVGDEVRGLPCAHNFHLACIDKWLSLNIKCPRCRCSVFPSLESNDLPNIPPDPNLSSTSHHAQSQSYLSRMQSFLMPLRTGNVASSNSNSDSSSNSNPDSNSTNNNNDSDVSLEMAENGGQPFESHGQHMSGEHGGQPFESHGQHTSGEHGGQPSESHGQHTSGEHGGQPSKSHGQHTSGEHEGQPSESHGQHTSGEHVQ
ncbi:E3 ubiquitin-protein ligase SIS3-like [Bidens hawaiensis]|uniref:E3 ubiquitin-protein ligase SIS3-like n=1 Tax=Bidens hawaiensis TaxID=980011 RepID=UPI0040498AEC